MRTRFRKVLVLSPHTDDSIIGAGALLHKLKKQGAHIIYVVFCTCRDTLEGTEFSLDTLEKEDRKAAAVLGIDEVIHLDFENKALEKSRQRILDFIYDYREDPELDLVIAPYQEDLHQDHRTVAWEALRASTRHRMTVIQYRIKGTSKDFNPNLFVPITADEAEVKMKALSCYESQFILRNNWFSVDTFWAELRSDGVYINTKFAEAFVQVRGTWILNE